MEIVKFETQSWSSTLVKKTQAIDMIWKLSFSLNVLLFSVKENFQTKSLCWNNIVAKFYVYSL